MIFDSVEKPSWAERIGRRLTARFFGSQVESLINEARWRSEALIEKAQKQVEEIRQQAATVDRDDHLWNGILTTKRDLSPIDQDRLLEVANHLATRNPLAKRIREIRRDFVIGEGCKIEAEDEDVQNRLDETWKDPVNNWEEFQNDVVDYLGINGETYIPTFVNEFTGAVQYGWIEPSEVEAVRADPRNRRLMREVVMKVGTGAGAPEAIPYGQKLTYQIISRDRSDPLSPTWNYRVGNIFQFKINCAPDARRGRSDIEAWADLVDAWDQAVFNDLERAIQIINFTWDIEFAGLTDEQIEEKMKKLTAPRPGAMRGHNEKVKWSAIAPNLQADDFRKLTDGIRADTLGAAGLSDFFFGITSDANRASAQALDTPILKGLTARQKKIRAIFTEMFDYALDQWALKQRRIKGAFELKRMSRAFEVKLPEISIKDLSKIGSVLTQVAAALEIAVQRQWLSNESAAKAFAAYLMQFDIKTNYEQEKVLIGKERLDREQEDITDEKQKKLADALKKAEPEPGEETEPDEDAQAA